MRRSAAWVIAGLVAAIGQPAIAATDTSNVLVLYSTGRLLPGNVEGDRGLHETVRAPADRSLMLFYEFLDAPRFGGEGYDELVAAYLRGKYASRPPRVIVALSVEALGFLLRHRAELFGQVPIVHAGIDRRVLRLMSPLPADVIGIPVEYDFRPTIDLALRWHPRARRLVIVTGAAKPDRDFEAQLRNDAPSFKDRATVEFLAALPARDVLRRLGELGDDAVVFTPGMFQDGGGRDLTPYDSVQAMAAASLAPVYGFYSSQIGSGIVGGYMPNFEAIGRQAGGSAAWPSGFGSFPNRSAHALALSGRPVLPFRPIVTPTCPRRGCESHFGFRPDLPRPGPRAARPGVEERPRAAARKRR